ncbi:MAG: hypothetical protein HZB38_05625 [Planctomycetes bacterium]|nr:hypothetical protein [Planctomycetota bacterium]
MPAPVISRYVALGIAAWTGAYGGGPKYRVARVGTLPGGEPGNVPADLNNRGQVCGRDFVYAVDYVAFRWDSRTGETIDLGTLGCFEYGSIARGINDLGHCCGGDSSDDDCFYGEAWLWTPERGMVGLGAIPGGLFPSSLGLAINNLDQVVGGAWGATFAEAMLWDPVAGMIGLGEMGGEPPSSVAYDINDSTWVVGNASSARGAEAFLWTPQDGMIGLGDFYSDGYADSDAFAINAHGHIAGQAATPVVGTQAFLWTPASGLFGLGFLDPDAVHQGSVAIDINDRDEIVGRSAWGAYYDFRSFVWDPVWGMRNIADLIDPCEPRHYRFDYCRAEAINNAGQIVLDMGSARYGVLLTPYLPADLDDNEQVDLFDLAALLSHFGLPGGASYQDGDLDCDADVDLQDLAILLGNFGETLP